MSAAVSWLPLAATQLDGRIRIAAVVVTALLLGVVLELVRRRRLVERYALLWMLVCGGAARLAIWNQLLASAADLLHIAVPANFLFIAAFGVAFVLLLHFSIATSRLSEETRILAQEVARLDAGAARGAAAGANGDGAAAEGAEQPARGGQPQSEARAAPAPPTSRRAARRAARASAPARPRYGEARSAVSAARELRRADRPAGLDPAALAQAAAAAARSVSPQASSFCRNQPPATETGTSASSVATSAGASSASRAAG